MEYPHSRNRVRKGDLYDVVVVGAGPVGLAVASELARMGFDVLVLDRRPPLHDDPKRRPQLLVARRGDLAGLHHLGVDIFDDSLVCQLAEREHGRPATGWSSCVEVEPIEHVPELPRHVSRLAGQSPVALIPIGALQQALLARAQHHGAEVRYRRSVTRVLRHARAASVRLDGGAPVRAKLVVIATGAARSLVGVEPNAATTRQMIGGVFDVTGDYGRWLRLEVPVRGYRAPVRCTMLQTDHESGAGTALLVDAPKGVDPTTTQLQRFFVEAANECGLSGNDYLVAPQPFGTAVTSVDRRVISDDNRAPVVIVGDAAQTGHVFSGMNCFVNLSLAIELCRLLEKRSGDLRPSTVRERLSSYEIQSRIGAGILHEVSQEHVHA